MTISQKLAELGIALPDVVPPVADYVPAKAHGDLVYTAGQLPMISGALPATGGVDRVTGVVKVTGFVASVPEFTGQPGVVNGASEVLGAIFGEAGRHARSAVGVPVLPLDAPVEVEVVFSFE